MERYIRREERGLMLLMYTGVDIVSISRFDTLSTSPVFLRRCFTASELEYCLSKSSPPQHLAARFAGKEAVIKALSGFGLTLDYRQIEITNAENGRPQVTYLTEHEEFQNFRTDISLSHSETSAIAFVIVYKDEDD